MTSTGFYYNCLVCDEKIETSIEKIEDITEVFAEKLLSLLWLFLGHLKVTNDDMFDFDFLVEPFPFCKQCTTLLIDLSKVHWKLTSSTCRKFKKKRNIHFQKKITSLVATLSSKILNTINDGNRNSNCEQQNQIKSGVDVIIKQESQRQYVNAGQSDLTCDDPDNQSTSIIQLQEEGKNQDLTQDEDTEITDLLKETKSKISIIRQSIANSYNVNVRLERIDPVTDKERLLQQFKSTQNLSDQTDDPEINTQDNFFMSDEEEQEQDKEVESDMNVDVDPLTMDEELLKYDDDEELSNESMDEDSVAAQLFPVIVDLDEGSETEQDKCKIKTKNLTRSKRKSKNKREDDPHWKATVEVSPNKFLFRNKFQFEKIDNAYVCSTCLYSSKKRQAVSSHIRTKHYDKDKFQCEYCSKAFGRNSDRRRHEALHVEKGVITLHPHCPSEIPRPPGAPETTNRKFMYKWQYPFETIEDSFKCGTCGFICNTRRNMTSHIRNMHLNKDKYSCRFCRKPFSRKYDLDRHELVHAQTKDFLCPTCGEAFKTPQHLKNHELTHQGIDPRKYFCELCPKRFYKRQMLNRHVIMKHTNEKPYECPVCSKRYGLRDSMIKHSKSHLQTLPYLCHLCGAGYATNSEVLRHIEDCHNPTNPKKQRKQRQRNIVILNNNPPTKTDSLEHLPKTETETIPESTSSTTTTTAAATTTMTVGENHVPEEFFSLIDLVQLN